MEVGLLVISGLREGRNGPGEVLDEEHREAALRARFGSKPVVYPPPPKSAFELQS